MIKKYSIFITSLLFMASLSAQLSLSQEALSAAQQNLPAALQKAVPQCSTSEEQCLYNELSQQGLTAIVTPEVQTLAITIAKLQTVLLADPNNESYKSKFKAFMQSQPVILLYKAIIFIELFKKELVQYLIEQQRYPHSSEISLQPSE